MFSCALGPANSVPVAGTAAPRPMKQWVGSAWNWLGVAQLEPLCGSRCSSSRARADPQGPHLLTETGMAPSHTAFLVGELIHLPGALQGED